MFFRSIGYSHCDIEFDVDAMKSEGMLTDCGIGVDISQSMVECLITKDCKLISQDWSLDLLLGSSMLVWISTGILILILRRVSRFWSRHWYQMIEFGFSHMSEYQNRFASMFQYAKVVHLHLLKSMCERLLCEAIT